MFSVGFQGLFVGFNLWSLAGQKRPEMQYGVRISHFLVKKMLNKLKNEV